MRNVLSHKFLVSGIAPCALLVLGCSKKDSTDLGGKEGTEDQAGQIAQEGGSFSLELPPDAIAAADLFRVTLKSFSDGASTVRDFRDNNIFVSGIRGGDYAVRLELLKSDEIVYAGSNKITIKPNATTTTEITLSPVEDTGDLKVIVVMPKPTNDKCLDPIPIDNMCIKEAIADFRSVCSYEKFSAESLCGEGPAKRAVLGKMCHSGLVVTDEVFSKITCTKISTLPVPVSD